MTWPVLTVREQAPLNRAAELLAENRFTALPVVDENGFLVGIVSEADLVGAATEGQTAPHTVGGVMSRDVISMSPGTDLGKLTHWILKLGLRAMPITDHHGRLVGVVTRTDLMSRDNRPASGVAREAQQIIFGRPARGDQPTQALSAAPPATPEHRRSSGYALRADDIMSTNPVVSVRESATVEDALELLTRYHFTALPVVDSEDRLVGIVSDADLIRDPRGETIFYPWRRSTVVLRLVSSVMTAEVAFGRPQSDLRELARWLLNSGWRVVPIVDDDRRLVGVVTRGDLVRVRDELNLPGFPAQEQPAEAID